jgi:hypothetical protein
MKGTLKRNMNVLKTTITDVAQNMKPTMICMCEVGDRNALSEDEMQQVADQSIRAWKDAATEHGNETRLWNYATMRKDKQVHTGAKSLAVLRLNIS